MLNNYLVLCDKMQNYNIIIVLVKLHISFVLLERTVYQENNYSLPRHTRQIENTECTLPPHPEKGFWSLLKGEGEEGDKVPISSVLTFECKSGHKLSSNIPSVCLGYWSSPVPTCEKLCPPLYASNTYDLKCINRIGREVNCSEATNGTKLEYNCKNFYETPFGFKKTLFCEDGKWDYPNPVCQPVCGKKISNDTNELIYGSRPSEKIEYPWVAAVYEKIGVSYENICGGSILSQRVVLTAAHCVTNSNGEVLPKENYMVGVGKLYRNYMAPGDTDAQYSELIKIIVPKEYQADFRRYAADIAVLVLKEEFVLSKVVQPVCFTNIKSIRLHPGSKGEVSGWGLAEGDRPSDVLRSLMIPYKYETVCAEELPPEWADRYNLADKICAGFVNKSTSVCKGDSGAGLAFRYREDNRYYVHGVVSVGHKLGGVCNIQQNAIYTRVVSYYDFINRLLTTYAPKSKDCILPPYPKNGKWTTDEWDWKPGDVVPSNTILRVSCHWEYILSSTATIDCSTGHNMPTCEKLCHIMEFPVDGLQQCTNRDRQIIDCSDATDESTLVYKCPPKYVSPFNTTYGEHSCLNGSWRPTEPNCTRVLRDCGKKEADSEMEHPWNVAIYKLSNGTEEKYKYVCGGTLISEYVVVTDARCISDEQGNVLPREDYAIAAGKLYSEYEDLRDTHAQFSNVNMQLSAITVHPQYKATQTNMYNIALLIAWPAFRFNSFVQPACVVDFEAYFNTDDDIIAGWRFKEGNSSLGRIQALEIHFSNEDCEIPSYFNDSLGVMGRLCNHFVNESVCLAPEDSGKGAIGIYKDDGRYYLQSVVNYYDGTECQKRFWTTDVFYYNNFINSAIF